MVLVPRVYAIISDVGSALPAMPDVKATSASVCPGFSLTHASAVALSGKDSVNVGSTKSPHAALKHPESCQV